MLKDVDKLPGGTPWTHAELTVNDPDGIGGSRKVDFYYQDPVSLVKEIIGNPAFNMPGVMAYEPFEVWVEGENEEQYREYSEAWTSDWWNEVQVGLSAFQACSYQLSDTYLE